MSTMKKRTVLINIGQKITYCNNVLIGFPILHEKINIIQHISSLPCYYEINLHFLTFLAFYGFSIIQYDVKRFLCYFHPVYRRLCSNGQFMWTEGSERTA